MKSKLWEVFKGKGRFFKPANLQRQDYNTYLWGRGEFLLTAGETAAAVCFLAYFFYRSFWAVLPISAVGVCLFRGIAEKKRDSCREQLTLQFKECILSVASSLKAGYAVENAFLESAEDMRLLYGERSLIYKELEWIRRGLVINITLEEQLTDLAERSGSGEIRQFVQVFSIAKRSGGNIPEIIKTSAELIGQRIETKQEMKTVLSGRRMEQDIMKLMPFGILAYIGFSYPGYFDSLYHNWRGAAVMTGCLAVYLAAYALGNYIIKGIEEEIM